MVVEWLNINSTILFSRLLVIMQRSAEFQPFFKFELTAVPRILLLLMVLWGNVMSVLAKELKKNIEESCAREPQTYVVDGGWLWHRVKWQSPLLKQNIAINRDWCKAWCCLCSWVEIIDIAVWRETNQTLNHVRYMHKTASCYAQPECYAQPRPECLPPTQIAELLIMSRELIFKLFHGTVLWPLIYSLQIGDGRFAMTAMFPYWQTMSPHRMRFLTWSNVNVEWKGGDHVLLSSAHVWSMGCHV